MAKNTRNFIAGKMNKVVDQRLVPNGEYIDAMNIRMGSTENSEIGVIENTKGNTSLTTLKYIDGTPLSIKAVCIGALEDSAKETIYWFVHDPEFTNQDITSKLDMIVSYNVFTDLLTYHIISISNFDDIGNTTLNFNPQYLITGVNMVEITGISGNSGLVFFTDYYNPPRSFNTTKNYPFPVSNVDQFTAESILVIKKPPTESPSISTFLTPGQMNFIETRFICFAYRYRYENGEYSAVSQFSEPAFTASSFNFSTESYLNEGMVNANNAVKIEYNTGGPLVKSIDLLFKEAASNLIRVIENINKAESGLVDNSIQEYIFNNSKIFTVLPDSEIFRLYDNVPLLAKAQTLMGNRLVYGNYIEGYNMVDSFGNPVSLEYIANLVETDIGLENLPDTTSTGTYSIDNAQTIADSILNINLEGLGITAGTPLPAGGSITIEVTLSHQSFSGSPVPSEVTDNIEITFPFFLQQSYTSVFALASSVEFQNAIHGDPVITTVADYCDGQDLTSLINCKIPNNLDSYVKSGSGISLVGQPIKIISTPASQSIGLQFVAMKYVGPNTVYEYYKVTFAQVTYQKISSPKSLHSNRGYEIGIVYMDDYNRSTTALVSQNNTVFVPCGNSGQQNSIEVTIPYTQIAPEWATRYKFVIKSDRENYETIYCSIFFKDPNSNSVYFLLEGENAQKVEQGDRLIVKADTSGVLGVCAYATILEKKVQELNFINVPSPINPAVLIPVPAGVYAKVNPNSFATVFEENAVVSYGTISDDSVFSGDCPTIFYPVSVLNPDGVTWEDYTIPQGSQIRLNFNFERIGSGSRCEKRVYNLDRTLTSNSNYDSFKDWWDGDDIESILNTGTGTYKENYYNPIISFNGVDAPCNLSNHYQFVLTYDGEMFLAIQGVAACGSTKNRRSQVSVSIDVFRANSLFIFETQPIETLPDIFYENELSFAIIDGNHEGNIQDQSFYTGTPAIIDTKFFNCYTFGNGAESYRIRDSIGGNTFNLGNKVTSVSAQDYKQANRFADLTYSGVYNDESNLNKLNEFNLGLVNFKPLEDSFGPVYLLDGRETDILVLQEDRISYVLAGKNLLSDASAGGAITSIPEVLGTQIARVEKYGISANPESYANWGYDRYFTDAKRGAVIQLKGSSYSNDQLIVVSELGMRTWFRDDFIANLNYQKIGGYDPYMDEYVLSSNDTLLPIETICTNCGINQTFNIGEDETLNFCVNVGSFIGEVIVSWKVTPIGYPFGFIVNGIYNGTTTTSNEVVTDGSIVINKDSQTVKTVDMQVIATGAIVLEITVACPAAQLMTVVEVCVTDDSDSGSYIHNEYRYLKGAYISPITSNLVTFSSGVDNPLVSRYNATTGYISSGSIPVINSTVSLICNKFGFDTFDFNPAKNKFRYLSSDTLYANTPTDIRALLAESFQATPNQGGGTFNYAEFTLNSIKDYLYLIWDYRTPQSASLCYSTNIDDACCDCATPCVESCNEYFVSNSSSSTTLSYRDCYTGEITVMAIEPYNGYFVCSNTNYIPTIETGTATIVSVNACGCNGCYGLCPKFRVEVISEASIGYTPCGGSPISVVFPPGIYEFCTSGDAPIGQSGVISIDFITCTDDCS